MDIEIKNRSERQLYNLIRAVLDGLETIDAHVLDLDVAQSRLRLREAMHSERMLIEARHSIIRELA